MTTAGNLAAAAYFNYQWRLELEFAPHRPERLPGEPPNAYLVRAARQMLGAIYASAEAVRASESQESFPSGETIN